MKPLLTDEELVQQLDITGITERSIATMRRAGKIPYVRVGYRTLFYDPVKVLQALEKHEVKAVNNGSRAGRSKRSTA